MTDNTMPSVADRVLKGMEFLSANYDNWRDLVDKDKFDIRHFSNCVAGQLERYYTSFSHRWELSDEDMVLMGLESPHHFFYGAKDDYTELQSAWDAVLL